MPVGRFQACLEDKTEKLTIRPSPNIPFDECFRDVHVHLAI